MAFTIKGLVSDGTLPTSAKTNLAADIGNPDSTVRAALDAAGLGAGASDADIAAFVQDQASATGTALASTFALKGETAPGSADKDAALRWARFQAGDTAAPLDVVYVGDSTMEGARATTAANRWVDQVTTALRGRYQPTGVKGGAGYRPIRYTAGVPFSGTTWTYKDGAAAGSNIAADSFTGTGELNGKTTPTGGFTWSVPVGVYSMSGGDAVNANGTNTLAYLNGLPTGDHEVTTTFQIGTLDATNQAVRIFAMSDGTDRAYLEATVNGAATPVSTWRLGYRVGGVNNDVVTWTPAALATPSGAEVNVSLKVEGLTITAVVNGETRTVTLTQAQKDQMAGGQVGFQVPGTGAKWHDMSVKTVGAGEVTVFPAERATHGLGLRALDIGPDVDHADTTFTGTAIDVVYTARSAGGTLSVIVDGNMTTVNTNAATEARGQKYRVGGLTSGSHTLRLSSTTSALVEGVMVYDGDENAGVRQWEGAHVGYNASSFTTNTAWSDSLKNLCTPDLAFVALGLNDYKAQLAPSSFKTNVETIIAEVKEANPNVSVVIHNSWERGDVTTPTYTWDQYTTALREIADADPQVYLADLDARLLGWNKVPAAYRTVWDADTVHLNNTGYRVTAATISGELLA